jgi:ketosteroid isomerase-like protein
MSQDLISKVQHMYASFGRGDLQAILDGLAEDVSWGVDSSAAGEVPWYGILNGKANAKKFFAALAEGADFTAFAPKDFVSIGDQVFNHLQYEAVVKKTGKKVSQTSLQHWTFKDGKVVRWRGYEDTARVRDALVG